MKKEKQFMVVSSICLLFFTFIFMIQGAIALDYPTRPVTVIQGFTPGGGADNVQRIIGKRAAEFLGQPFVVEYKTGASATIAPAHVAKSKPDGYTLWLGSGTPALIAPLVKKDLGYTMENFVPICGYAETPNEYIVRNDGRWNTLNEFIADAKKNPGKFNFSAAAPLGVAHFSVEALAKLAGIKLIFVPFPGASEANAALLGGHIDIVCSTVPLGLYESGRIKILALDAQNRVKLYPEIPTLTELGYPITFSLLYFLAAPKGTPKEVIDKLYDAHKKAFAKYGEEIETLLLKLLLFPSFLSPEEVIKKNASDKKLYYDIAKDLKVLVNP